MSTSSKVFLVVLLLLGGGAVGGFLYWNSATAPAASLSTGAVTVEIPEGTGARGVAALLEDAGVIRSATAFAVSAAADGRASAIRAGTYELDPAWSVEQILDVLTTAPVGAEVFSVTIPEGLTVDQTLERIATAAGSPHTVESLREALMLVAVPEWVPQRDLPEGAEAFEGLLFPNTYEFRVVDPPEAVLSRLVEETEAVVQEVGAAPRNGLDLYQTLVLASLIEREARLAEERPVISSVIHNRLEVGQALQIDATVVYAIEVATGERKDRLLTEDYQFASPWSTYTNPGLPPTPISGAGRSSIEAAAAPQQTDFFYYVVEDPATGRHRFSRTLEEHNQAIAEIRGG